MESSSPPGKKGRQLFILLRADEVNLMERSVGFLRCFLIHCFWISKALWGKMVFDTSAITLVTMSIVTAKVPVGSCFCSSREASKVVRVSPLSKVLMMAILSPAWVMLFCFQTSAISFWVSIYSWGVPLLKRLMCFL